MLQKINQNRYTQMNQLIPESNLNYEQVFIINSQDIKPLLN